MRLLAVDGGNTHVDWATKTTGGDWHGHDRVASGKPLDSLAKAAQSVDAVCACCVGGDAQRERMEQALAGCETRWIETMEAAGGVTNNYKPPESLGVDRWCALLGLRAKYCSGVAVLAGTAVTVDPLPEDGVFSGGLIVPGFGAMLRAIQKDTAIGSFDIVPADAPPVPDNTAAAATAGAMHAIAGAALSFLGENNLRQMKVVVAGGYANSLAPLLPNSQTDRNLVFDGMAVAAGI